MIKLAFNKETGIVGAFGEDLKAENYVLITEEIKNYILTNCVRLKEESLVIGKKVTIQDFEELKNEFKYTFEDYALDLEFRLSLIELGGV